MFEVRTTADDTVRTKDVGYITWLRILFGASISYVIVAILWDAMVGRAHPFSIRLFGSLYLAIIFSAPAIIGLAATFLARLGSLTASLLALGVATAFFGGMLVGFQIAWPGVVLAGLGALLSVALNFQRAIPRS